MSVAIHHSTPGSHTGKRTAEVLLQCMEIGAKLYRALSISRLKEFQGIEANCWGTEAWGQVQTSSLPNLEGKRITQFTDTAEEWGPSMAPSSGPPPLLQPWLS